MSTITELARIARQRLAECDASKPGSRCREGESLDAFRARAAAEMAALSDAVDALLAAADVPKGGPQ